MREFKGRSILEFPSSYVVIDVETTGLDPVRDSLIEVAALKIQDFQIVDSYSSLINPGIPISSFTTNLTGISNEQLSTAPEPVEVLDALKGFIGTDVVVGHNVNFDINFLYDNFEKYLHTHFSNNYLDTLRFSRKFFKLAPSHKLPTLAEYLQINVDVSHRALEDCYTTNQLYMKLLEASTKPSDQEQLLLDSMHYDNTNPFYGKQIVVKGLPQYYTFGFMKAAASKCNAKLSDIFYKSCDYIVFSKFTYKKYKYGERSLKFEKADRLVEEGSLTILSEDEWCQMMGLPIPSMPQKVKEKTNLDPKKIVTENTEFDETHPLYNKLCVFTGTLEKMVRKDAMQIVVDLGGQVGNSVTKNTNYLILGNNDYCPLIKDGKSSKQKKAESLKLAGNDIEIISEDVFYDMISEN